MTSTTAAMAPQEVSGFAKAIFVATAVAGALDIGDATVDSLLIGMSPVKMLQGIASALVGKAAGHGGLATAGLGLGLHFTIMLVMATVFVLAASRLPVLTRRPILWGPLYGIGLYLVMYWIVLPLRWPALWGRFEPLDFANQIFAHTCLVGLPIALIIARLLKRPAA
jgi:uncharacterized membrane protein YagU involved in acid resistance